MIWVGLGGIIFFIPAKIIYQLFFIKIYIYTGKNYKKSGEKKLRGILRKFLKILEKIEK